MLVFLFCVFCFLVCVFFVYFSPHVNSCLLSICVQFYRVETQMLLIYTSYLKHNYGVCAQPATHQVFMRRGHRLKIPTVAGKWKWWCSYGPQTSVCRLTVATCSKPPSECKCLLLRWGLTGMAGFTLSALENATFTLLLPPPPPLAPLYQCCDIHRTGPVDPE
jgi:hypothetical protein